MFILPTPHLIFVGVPYGFEFLWVTLENSCSLLMLWAMAPPAQFSLLTGLTHFNFLTFPQRFWLVLVSFLA